MRRLIGYAITLSVVALLLQACANPTGSADSKSDTTGISSVYSWTLPKTVVDISSVWTFKGCKPNEKSGQIAPVADVKVTAVARAVPDGNLGPVAPTGWMSLNAPTQSFWQDVQIDVKTTAGSHLLQSLSSTATNQAGPILNNVFTTLVKGFGIAAGVPTGASPNAKNMLCDETDGGALARLRRLNEAQAALAKLEPDSAKAKVQTSAVQAEQAKLSFTVTATIDPGTDSKGAPVTIDADGKVKVIGPTIEQIVAAKWLNQATIEKVRANEIASPFEQVVYLNFAQANPPNVGACPGKPDDFSCGHSPTQLTKDALFREVAYVPLEVYAGRLNTEPSGGGDAAKVPQFRTVFPFAQFGISRSLPLKAPAFGKAGWTLAFNDFGEITDAIWGSTAIGNGLSSAVSGAVSAASAIDAERLKANQQLDSATQAQQLLNNKLNVWIQGANLAQQCQTLLAKGQVPQCD